MLQGRAAESVNYVTICFTDLVFAQNASSDRRQATDGHLCRSVESHGDAQPGAEEPASDQHARPGGPPGVGRYALRGAGEWESHIQGEVNGEESWTSWRTCQINQGT